MEFEYRDFFVISVINCKLCMMELSITQYAKLRGISRTGVWNAITRGHAMPGVIRAKLIGRTYTLDVEAAWVKAAKKKLLAA